MKNNRTGLLPDVEYLSQMTLALTSITDMDEGTARAFVQKQMDLKKNEEPVITYFKRDPDTLDKHVETTPVLQYYRDIVKNDEIVAPSGTSYLPKYKSLSSLSKIMKVNGAARGILKKEMFAAMIAQDTELQARKNVGQKNKKLNNNRFSGVLGTKASFLYNPSGHSSLTSTIRMGTSISNVLMERFLAGSRNYQTPHQCSGDILSMLTQVDLVKIQELVNKYELHIPTADEVFEVLKKGLYWRLPREINTIKRLVSSLSDVQRVAILYTGDFDSLARFNDKVVRELIHSYITVPNKDYEGGDAVANVKSLNDAHVAAVAHILFIGLRGKGTEIDKLDDALVRKMAVVADNIKYLDNLYGDLLNTFFVNGIIPAGATHTTHMVRHAVPMSDTDSTARTFQRIAKWYVGRDEVTNETIAIMGIMSYIGDKALGEYLDAYSRTMGVSEEDIGLLEMKSEVSMSSMAVFGRTKHYIANNIINEGNVLHEPSLDVKGVGLKSSALPKVILDDATKIMESNNAAILNNKRINLGDIITHEISVELAVKKDVLAGKTNYLRHKEIKDADAYSDPKVNPTIHVDFWNSCMERLTQYRAEIPVISAVIPTSLTSKRKMAEWLSEVNDEQFTRDVYKWMDKHGRTDIPTLYLPVEYLEASGIPVQIKNVVDYKRIIMDLAGIYYMVLESLGYYKRPKLTLMEEYGYE